jgi:hypothetical protein
MNSTPGTTPCRRISTSPTPTLAVATASALSYWASNRMVQLARTNLGWTADLGGTGMCLTAEAFAAAGGFGTSLVEDQELGVRLFLAGIPVRWLHDVRVATRSRSDSAVAVSQRSRWAAGRAQVARRWVGPLLRTRTPAGFDLALAAPPAQPDGGGGGLRGLAVAVWSVSAVVGGCGRRWPRSRCSLRFPFLARDGVAGRHLLRYPLFVLLPLLKIPARLLRQRGWYHTPHGSSATPPEPAPWTANGRGR